MERKKRYCPQCGSKTNDMRCEICERVTKSMNDRFNESYLNLMEDDIETFDHIQAQQKNRTYEQNNEQEDVHVNLDHIEKNVKLQGRRRTHLKRERKPINTLWKIRIFAFVLLVIVGSIIAGFAIRTYQEQLTQYEVSSLVDDYTKYLVPVQEQVNLTCEMQVNAKDTNKIHLVNPTPYYVDITLYGDEEELSFFSYLEPNAQYEITSFHESARVEVNAVYDLNYHKPTIAYQYKTQGVENNRSSSYDHVIVATIPSSEELKNLMQFIYAGRVLNEKLDTTYLDIYVGGDKENQHMYEVHFDFSKGTIVFYEDQDYPAIETLSQDQ